ncbi:dihydroneopterin aldolase [Alteromonas lipolytica]|uniref:7,8-dihydroneopterin aldolase n=1 Tax=Alteromonas lipolytica TaxID=1856405 RepID=A0A1E8FF69_9ALTE|nr:dihydroneopterin aldolase [Alteromonas lipolytica]OFI34248.1 dihydroneopterin aldolase [Alteromonas lipolytica]GGF69015.1 7,8-dihydroneopterin aldolase [Alteromonas lipolytica]
MQQIFIEGLEVPTLIGVYDWERTRNTTLIIDLLVDANLSAAMGSDEVADTIDYAAMAETVKQVGKDSQFELLEAFANAVITALCETFPIQKLVLTIEKPGILPDARKVGIRITHEVTA